MFFNVTKQYNLVMAKGRRYVVAGKVTAILAEVMAMYCQVTNHRWAYSLITWISSCIEHGNTLPF